MMPMARYPRVAVVGAGTMGAQIACLLAGAGTRVDLLDLDAEIAANGLKRVTGLRPSPLYLPAHAANIAPGGLDRLEEVVPRVDWILEAVVEQLEPKRDLFARIDAALPEDGERPVISTNTSGISIRALAEGRSPGFRSCFLGTHFFNPPRYTRLLELIPIGDTDPAVTAAVADFASRQLGKGTVIARDTPAFIANRLGVHGLMAAIRLAEELGLGPDEVDDLTGPLLGRPKSATFRTLDLVGLDVAVAVADHCHADLVEDPRRDDFTVPQVLRGLIEKGALGEKTGAGLFRKAAEGIEALDLETGEYRPRRRIRSGSVEMARNETDLGRRVGMLVAAEDAAGEFLRRSLSSELGYATAVAAEIADDAASIDAAMRWGFGWELGPFQLMDALGEKARDRLLGEGGAAAGLPDAFYADGTGWDFRTSTLEPITATPGALDLDEPRRRAAAAGLPSNAAASVVELPDNILGLELHGKLNIIGLDTISIATRAIELAADRYDGLVIGTRSADFGAGANLALLLIEAEEGEWDELDRAVRGLQGVAMAMRYAPVPVVVAPRGRTLGGAAELVLAADRAQPLAETYIGLVEVGLGLIPAGGGSTAMARRAAEQLPGGAHGDLFTVFQHVFTGVATARVAMGAWDARDYLLLRDTDPITANPDRQWGDAVRTARSLAEPGYRPPGETRIPVLGRRGIAAAESLTYNQLVARQMSEHDRKVVLELARVMSGGDVAEGTAVGERYLLDLEREAFLRLLGEKLTRDRIRHVLKTGKPLRN
jgi:3-hydroxyacyl-CoA dehydrogenase